MGTNEDWNYEELLAEETLVVNVLEDLLGALKDKGLSQADLARRLGVSRSSVNRIFRGRNLTVRTVARLAHAIGVDMNFQVQTNRFESLSIAYRSANTPCQRTDNVYQFRSVA